MKKLFYVMVATTILATNPLLAMDGFDERPTSPPATPLHKSAKILGCLPDQSGAITLNLEQLANLTNSGKLLRRDEDESLYRVKSRDGIYDIKFSKEGADLIDLYTIKEQEKKEPALGSLPLMGTKISALAAEDRSQKIHFSRKISKKVKFISEPYSGDEDEPMFCISRVSAKQLYQEQEWAARIAEKKAKPFMDLERVYKYNFKTVCEWRDSAVRKVREVWLTKIGEVQDFTYQLRINEDLINHSGVQGSDNLYFEFVGEKEVVYESRGCFPKLCSFQEGEPEGYFHDNSLYYFAGYLTGKIERAPIAFIAYNRHNGL